MPRNKVVKLRRKLFISGARMHSERPRSSRAARRGARRHFREPSAVSPAPVIAGCSNDPGERENKKRPPARSVLGNEATECSGARDHPSSFRPPALMTRITNGHHVGRILPSPASDSYKYISAAFQLSHLQQRDTFSPGHDPGFTRRLFSTSRVAMHSGTRSHSLQRLHYIRAGTLRENRDKSRTDFPFEPAGNSLPSR